MDLSQAVKKTLEYGNFFNFPLSLQEICLWLIYPKTVQFSTVKKYLPTLSRSEIAKKEILLKNTKQKEKLANNLIKYVRFIPTIRLVALTGSVAANNSQEEDDIDLLIITSSHTLWITRPIFLLLLSFKFNRRHPGDNPAHSKNAFCPNLWLDMCSLTVLKKLQNIYTAHEVLQIKPVFDRGETYKRFIRSNIWTKKYLANAYRQFQKGKILKKVKKHSNLLFFPLNLTFFIFQYLYMLPRITTELITLHSAYFHKNDLSKVLTPIFLKKTL